MFPQHFLNSPVIALRIPIITDLFIGLLSATASTEVRRQEQCLNFGTTMSYII